MSSSNKLSEFSNMRSKKTIVAAAILFQAVWFACVLGPTYVWIAAAIVYLAIYLFVFKCTRYLFFIAVAGSLGISVDFALYSVEFIQFESGRFPAWLVMLWFIFVSSIPLAFAFLRKRYWLAFVLGGPGGASSYFAASRFRDDVSFDFAYGFDLLPLVLVWSLLMPSLVYLLEILSLESLEKYRRKLQLHT